MLNVLTVTNLPIYLPFNYVPVVFGDPFTGIACTNTTDDAIVFTVPGYFATAGDGVMLSVVASGYLPTTVSEGVEYVVYDVSTDTFEIALPATPSTAIVADGTSTVGSGITVHVLTQGAAWVAAPYGFKPNNTVVALNLNADQSLLYGAQDTSGGSGAPAGPAAFSGSTGATIATLAAGTGAAVTLNWDWIKCTSSYPLVLISA